MCSGSAVDVPVLGDFGGGDVVEDIAALLWVSVEVAKVGQEVYLIKVVVGITVRTFEVFYLVVGICSCIRRWF